MSEILETAVAGANLGPTVLLGLMLLYWLAVLIGVVGLDLFDFDLDLDADVDMDVGDVSGDFDVDADASSGATSSALSVGAVVLKSVNIGRVPLMVWLSCFALAMWTIMILWDHAETHQSLMREILILLRNAALAVLAAKLMTQPIRGQFEDAEAPRAKDVVGRICLVTTPEITERSGQIRCETGAAPLLLNSRIKQDSEPLKKGDEAVVIAYQQGIYFVRKAQPEDLK